jgi:FAD/FMN-containing dehydrogenase
MRVHLVSPAEYPAKVEAAVQQFAALRESGRPIALKKRVRHTFKDRASAPNLDLTAFDRVQVIDTERCLASVEGFTSFYGILASSLQFGMMPQAVPELRSITVGGAIAGLGGQSSSFRFGLIHEMVTSFDLLTGTGDVLHCSDLEHSDLFTMLPNSYGTLGYVLRCDIRLNRVMPYVRVSYGRYDARAPFFAAMEEVVRDQAVDFVEGVCFAPDRYVLLTAEFAPDPRLGERLFSPLPTPFFAHIRDSGDNGALLTVRDYIWRWDYDAFWSTDQGNIFGRLLLNPAIRRSVGRAALRSDRLIQLGKFRNRLRKRGAARLLFQEAGRREALVQDTAIPFDKVSEFDRWLGEELAIYPLWYCPVRTMHALGTYPLYDPGAEFVVDIGFYRSMDLAPDMDAYYHNRRIEEQLLAMGGIKCLYSDTFFSEDDFWSIYNRAAYEAVKARYDPQNTFRGLYEKVVTGPQAP